MTGVRIPRPSAARRSFQSERSSWFICFQLDAPRTRLDSKKLRLMQRSEIDGMIELMATLRVHIVPHAKDDVVIGEHGDAIKIKLRAPARKEKTKRSADALSCRAIASARAYHRTATRPKITRQICSHQGPERSRCAP